MFNALRAPGGPLLLGMFAHQAGPSASLQRVWNVCSEDGPPLPVGQQLRRLLQLQVLCTFPRLRPVLLHLRGVIYAQVLFTILVSRVAIGRGWKVSAYCTFSTAIIPCIARIAFLQVPRAVPLLRERHVLHQPGVAVFLSPVPGLS